MSLAIIYSNRNQECDRVQSLLDNIDHKYLVYHLGCEFTQKQFEEEFGVDAEYPQVSIDIDHIGGLKETLNYLKDKDYL